MEPKNIGTARLDETKEGPGMLHLVANQMILGNHTGRARRDCGMPPIVLSDRLPLHMEALFLVIMALKNTRRALWDQTI